MSAANKKINSIAWEAQIETVIILKWTILLTGTKVQFYIATKFILSVNPQKPL